MKSISKYLALEGNIRVLAAQTFVSQIGLGMFYVIWQPFLLSTGITVSESNREPASAKTTVHAIGRNILPSMP